MSIQGIYNNFFGEQKADQVQFMLDNHDTVREVECTQGELVMYHDAWLTGLNLDPLDAYHDLYLALNDVSDNSEFLDFFPRVNGRLTDIISMSDVISNKRKKYFTVEGVVMFKDDNLWEEINKVFLCTKCGVSFVRPLGIKPESCPNCLNTWLTKGSVEVSDGTQVNLTYIQLGERRDDGTMLYVNGFIYGLNTQNLTVGEKIVANCIRNQQKEGKYYTTIFMVIGWEGSKNMWENVEFDTSKYESVDHNMMFERVIKSIAPSVVGYKDIKKAIALQMVLGGKWEEVDETTTRIWINLLLPGEPGTAKSRLMEALSKIHPKVAWAGGSRTTTAGLTVGLEDHPIKRGSKIPRPGALVRGHKGIALVDEMDKVDDKDMKSIQSAMESGVVSVAMSGVNATFKAETCIFACCNPEKVFFKEPQYGGSLKEQVGIPDEIMSRFDLIYTLVDKADKVNDKAIAEVMWNGVVHDDDIMHPLEIREYIGYLRSLPLPSLNQVAGMVSDWFVKIRQEHKDDKVGKRVMNTIKRLSLGFGIFRQSKDLLGETCVTEKDVTDAQDMYHQMLSNLSSSDTWDSYRMFSPISSDYQKLRDRILTQIRTQGPTIDELVDMNPKDEKYTIEKELLYLKDRRIVYEDREGKIKEVN